MKKYRPLVIPYVVWMSVFIVVPMLLIVFYAFTTVGNQMIPFQFSLINFKKFFDPVFLKVLLDSFRIAAITTAICLLVGYPLAYFISRRSERMQTLLILLVTIPMWINMLVRTYAWISILSDKGLINSFLALFGIAPLKMMNTDFAVILGMVYNFLPFMIMQIYNVLAKMDESLIEASYDLGANRFETFRKIVFPLSLSGVISGITLVFLPSLSTFVIPQFLGGGSYVLIGNLIENQFINIGDYNFGSAISLIMAVLIMLSMHFANKFDREYDESKPKGGKL
ncbi:ABC transporter permease [Erysipelothrix rhusiopathiae]|uniref:ABC transporter, permease protein n=2 Tax=Erysipelothrix TaxID=1647 RepID=E7FWP4_ERYRH|nr:ABC transporter permease [Erysipelothrix rhusiopathiae]CAH2760441.1 ABC transporter permease [Erysipelothrix sp. A18Y020d]AGN24786.1 spermidine/putrescine ABC transporter permease [Erysipelothrix rhusiopathiae SY1027]AMS10473.1 ABC transporter permease [Erysipelothrix rhusiopathiae]AOO67185.1 ABC transporter permease [Erysipelothrix rhusiopathiae]AWU42163.1 ABC transporter permease [Erysipelothrix rhusiopathiae]